MRGQHWQESRILLTLQLALCVSSPQPYSQQGCFSPFPAWSAVHPLFQPRPFFLVPGFHLYVTLHGFLVSSDPLLQFDHPNGPLRKIRRAYYVIFYILPLPPPPLLVFMYLFQYLRPWPFSGTPEVGIPVFSDGSWAASHRCSTDTSFQHF